MNLLGAIDSFIKVVETGSIVGAAKTLGVSAAAVSQTVNRLETHLARASSNAPHEAWR